jgi:AraC-like DNA-binding protein
MSPEVGPNATEWPGLTTYRFDRPQPLQWVEVQSLALCCVVHGRKRFVIGGDEYVCDPAHYLLLTRGMRFQTEILEATAAEPYLSLVLQLDVDMVDSVLVDMAAGRARSLMPPGGRSAAPATYVSPADHDLAEAILRFIRSLATAADRRVLAPMRLREITYRLMHVEQVARLLHAAAIERESDPVRQATQYIHDHVGGPLTVADMARHVMMSPSALTARFVEATGVGPYQYAKRVRLDRARALLIEGELTVTEVVREVGYTSVSYFINEFKRQFGTTPGTYARQQRQAVAMRVEEATQRAA